jgi:hypothetical protein
MNPSPASLSRRAVLRLSGLGFGGLALSYLTALEKAHAAPADPGHDLPPRPGHFAGTAKAVIMLCQNGGPSQMDLLDPKPGLQKRNGQTYASDVETFQKGNSNVLFGSPFKFHKRGRSGLEISEVMPFVGRVADELCLVRSMHTGHNNHTEGLVMLQTGKTFFGRPALGAWVSYALGTENQNLPAYVVLRDPAGYNTSGKLVWSSGWLPALFQGVEFSTAGTPVQHLYPDRPVPPDVRRGDLDLLARLNAVHLRTHPGESELEARIRNYELASRMQLAAGAALDLKQETVETRRLYGLDNPATAGYGTRCLLARRLVESGVRFVQVHPPLKPSFQPWDSHNNLKGELETICGQTDRPTWALITDLKRRGLLDQTIVLWAGEFGRLPVTQNGSGRDHNRHAFSLFLAGGGFRAGFAHGETDEVGYRSVSDRVSVSDLHATLLCALGLDHDRLTYSHQGHAETLTDAKVSRARVVTELLKSAAS